VEDEIKSLAQQPYLGTRDLPLLVASVYPDKIFSGLISPLISLARNSYL